MHNEKKLGNRVDLLKIFAILMSDPLFPLYGVPTMNTTETVTTAQLAEVVRTLPLGQFIHVIMEKPASDDMLKKHREDRSPNPYYDAVKRIEVDCTGGGKPKNKDRKLQAAGGISTGTSYQREVNKARIEAGEAADFVAQPDKHNDRIDGSPLMQGKKDGTLKLDMANIDWDSCVSELIAADGSKLDRRNIRSYLSQQVLDRMDGLSDGPPLTMRVKLQHVVELHANNKVYKVIKPKRATMADLASRLGQTSQAASN